MCEFSMVQVMSFVAPKIIGGVTAPSPVGGMVEMTQALDIVDVSFEQVLFILKNFIECPCNIIFS